MEKIPEKSKFIWVGNNTAIDFINTQIVADGEPVDLLEDSEDVLHWMNEAGILTVSTQPRNLLEEVIAYRAQLRQGVEKLASGSRIPLADLDSTNAYLSRAVAWPKLERDKSGYRLTTVFQPERAADYMYPIAHAFAQLLSTGDLGRLRKCANPDCILYYYDTSKGGQRTWCSLDICGNKLRMAALRARRSLSAQ
jgi:predicted RNA-binding Zn ribbon-like protein